MRSPTSVTRLKSAQCEHGWDDARLAKESGIHITLIRRYKKGEVTIGKKNGLKLAHVLGIPLESLLCDPPTEPVAGSRLPASDAEPHS